MNSVRTPSVFTAREIASALKRQRTHICSRLAEIPSDSRVFVHGNAASAWRLESLPQDLRQALHNRSRRLGYASPEALLSEPPKAWVPPVQTKEIHPDTWSKAEKLRLALKSFMAGRPEGESEADFAARGVAAFQAALGYEISAKHWWDIWNRTADRDNGLQDWNRLELYLPDKIKRMASSRKAQAGLAWGSLAMAIASVAEPGNPTPEETANIWESAFELLEDATESGIDLKAAKRELLAWLHRNASFLAPSETLLRNYLNRKHRAWLDSGKELGALIDRRPKANQARRVEVSKSDRDKILGVALQGHHGELAPGWREALDKGLVSRELASRYISNPRDKSHLPDAVLRVVGPESKALLPWRRGPRQAKLNGAYIERDWSKVGAGDYFTSDDFTLEVYFYLVDENGQPTLTRGQWLPMIDCRSKRILEFILIPEKHYTGLHIRTLINHTEALHGLPRFGFHFECGIWKQAAIVGGEVPWGIVKSNFATRLGIKIRHANPGNARSKIVENVGRIYQSSLRDVPGWVGRDEQALKIEDVQAAKNDVLCGRKDPAEAGFLSYDQFFRVLTAKVEAYNAREQNSRIMGGNKEVSMSPDEAWRLYQTRDGSGQVVGLAKLPENCRYLLATHCERMSVGRNGLRLRSSLGGGRYRSPELAAFAHREVNVYFDPEFKESIFVRTDEDQLFSVPIVPPTPAMDATPQEMEAATASLAAWNNHFKARLSEIRAAYKAPVLPCATDARTVAIGKEMAAQRQVQTERKRHQEQQEGRARKVAQKEGLPAPASPRIAALYNTMNSLEP